MIKVLFACGHRQEWQDGETTPVCKVCGERRIGRVTAPAPRFAGACQGPVVQESKHGK